MGNQFTLEQATSFASTSAEKLKCDYNNILIDPVHRYVLIHFLTI